MIRRCAFLIRAAVLQGAVLNAAALLAAAALARFDRDITELAELLGVKLD